MNERIYLDFNASTPIAPSVRDAMLPFLEAHHGNPSSQHWAGAPAKKAVETARSQVAELIGASPPEIVFTSGGSESNNSAIKGTWWTRSAGKKHVVTSAIEHPATLRAFEFLERQGADVTTVGVDRLGRIDPAVMGDAIREDTLLVSIMHANNEVGTVQPIKEIAEAAREHGALIHSDAAQSLGKIPVRVDDLGVDLLSIAGHKLYAPKGIGALYLRSGVRLEPLIHGGGHESGRRAGTESALLAVGLGEAARLAARAVQRIDPIRRLRDRLWTGLEAIFKDRVVLNGHPEERLPNTLNVSFLGRSGPDQLAALEGVALSTGSACHEGSVEMSPVLRAMHASDEVGLGAVRFSLGTTTTEEEIEMVLRTLTSAFDPAS